MPAYAPAIIPLTLCSGRLTTESGVAVSTSDRTAQGTVYFTPFRGNQIALYDGSGWGVRTFTERSLTLASLTSGKNYDVFAYDSAGTVTLELSTSWTSDTARADALTTQDGVLVKSGSTTRRYLGTLRTTGTTTTEDSQAKRFLWNYEHRLPRSLLKQSSSAYTYSSTTRQMNADTTNQVELITGQRESVVCLSLNVPLEINLGERGTVSIGENSTSTTATGCSPALVRDFSSTSDDNKRITVLSELITPPRLGYSAYTMLETTDSGTIQFVSADLRGLWHC